MSAAVIEVGSPRAVAMAMLANGYSPVPIVAGTKAVRVIGWTRWCAVPPTPADIAAWRDDNFAGVGIACGTATVAVDIDLLDHAEADRVEELAREMLGDTPLRRVGMAPKRALVYACAGRIEPVKRVGLDVVGFGQQLVADAIHPKTGRPYEWGKATPLNTPAANLPAVTNAQIAAFVAAIGLPEIDLEGGGRMQPVVRDDQSGLVVDGREAWLTLCVWRAVNGAGENATTTAIADAAWRDFSATTDLVARPNSSLSRRHAEQKVSYARRRIAHGVVRSARRDFALTDVGNGERLVARHGVDLRYCFKWDSWLAWDGRRWRRDDERGEAVRRAKDTAISIYDEARAAAAEDSGERAKKFAEHAARTQQRARLEAMLWAARPDLAVSPGQLDQNPNVLNLENGTLELDTIVLREHRRDDLITKLAPVALIEGASAPRWSAFIGQIFAGDAELISFVQRAAGYSLTGSVAEQVFFLCHGGGANGKSTLLAALSDAFGDYAAQLRVDALLASDRSRAGAASEDVADLFGVRLAVTAEPDAQFRLNESLVKTLTGGDRIRARRLYEQLFEFEPSHKIWLAANHQPEIRGVDEAIWRRVLLVPFDVTIPSADRDARLPQKLHSELPGILRWCVEGLRAYRERGLDPPEKVIAATAEYRSEQDKLRLFLEAETEQGAEYAVPVNELASAYVAFAGDEAFAARTLNAMLRERGFRQRLARLEGRPPARVWQGLRLKRPRANLEVPF